MPDEQYFFPNAWGRLILEASEEVLGAKGVNAMLNMAGLPQYVNSYPPDDMKKEISFDAMGKIFGTIYDAYGKRGAQAVSRIAGKNTLLAGLQKFGQLADAASAAMKLGSVNTKLKTGLRFMAKMVSTLSDQVNEVEETDQYFIYTVIRCPICWERSAEEPVCSFIASNLQAALVWGTGNRFNIKEVECTAKGDAACVFHVDKTPLD